MTEPAGKAKLQSLDALRAALMLLGVFFHSLLAYTKAPVAYWPVFDPAHARGAELFILYLHAFRMPAFFYLAGLLAAAAFRRHGTREFFRRRFRRLGLPLIFAVLTIAPLMLMMALWGRPEALEALGAYVHHPELRGTSGIALARVIFTSGDFVGLLRPAHLWFLVFLLIFSALTPLASKLQQWKPSSFTYNLGLVGLPWLTLVISHSRLFIDSPDTWIPAAHVLAYYGVYFFWGLTSKAVAPSLAPKGQYWQRLGWGHLAFFVYLGGAGVMAARPELTGPTITFGLRPLSLLALAVAVRVVVPNLIALVAAATIKVPPAVSALTRASYWIYLVHLVPVLALQQFAVAVPLPGLAKAILVAFAGSALSFLVFHGLVRRTAMGRLLAGDATPASN